MSRPPTVPLAVLSATLLFAAGCLGDSAADDPGAAPAPATEADAPDTGTDSTDGDPAPPAALDDGAHLGFVTDVQERDGSVVVTVDPATWVDDPEADNGYRIDDPDDATVDLTVTPDAIVRILRSTGDPSTEELIEPTDLAPWMASIVEDAPLFDVTVADGVVTAMQFRYRP